MGKRTRGALTGLKFRLPRSIPSFVWPVTAEWIGTFPNRPASVTAERRESGLMAWILTGTEMDPRPKLTSPFVVCAVKGLKANSARIPAACIACRARGAPESLQSMR